MRLWCDNCLKVILCNFITLWIILNAWHMLRLLIIHMTNYITALAVSNRAQWINYRNCYLVKKRILEPNKLDNFWLFRQISTWIKCLLSPASVLFPSDPSRPKWTTDKNKMLGGGVPTNINYDWGTTRRATKLGIEFGFGVFFFWLVVLFCTLPVVFCYL